MNTELQRWPQGMAELTNQQTSGNTYPAEWFTDWATGGVTSDSGEQVTGYSALTHTPIWQGINIIAGDIGQIPIRLVRDEFQEVRTHPSWNLLRLQPNALQTASVWKETMQHWAIMWGNGISWIIWGDNGRPQELIPLRPDAVYPIYYPMDDGTMQVVYHYGSPYGALDLTLLPEDVVHVRGLTSDGYWGYPLFQVGKNQIGGGLALQKHGNSAFKNGVMPAGIVKTAGKMSPEDRANLRRDFERLHAGASNTGRTIVLHEAMEFQSTSMTNTDAQWIEAMKYDRQQSASLLNLPAYMLNSHEDYSGRANLEEAKADYMSRTLTRWMCRWSEELGSKLLQTRDWLSDRYKYVWDTEQFLSGDIDTMSQIADRMVKAEIITRNEARGYFGLPPIAGADQLANPAINPQPNLQPPAMDDEDDDNEEELEAHWGLVTSILADGIEYENRQVRSAAKTEANFLAWLNYFYDPGGRFNAHISNKLFTKPMCEALNAAGISVSNIESAVEDYATGRHAELLDTAGTATKETLPLWAQLKTQQQPGDVARAIILPERDNART